MTLWQIFMQIFNLFVVDLCFLSVNSSLFTKFLYLFAAVLKAGSANHNKQFCKLIQNICHSKSIFQSNLLKKKLKTLNNISPFLASHGTWIQGPWVASPAPYPLILEISYWKKWKIGIINIYGLPHTSHSLRKSIEVLSP